jgi:hypothetical protein
MFSPSQGNIKALMWPARKKTPSTIFSCKRKEGRKGNAVTTRAAAKRNAVLHKSEHKGNQTGAKRSCNRCGEESTYEHRQNCPAKVDTCTKCNKKGHRAVICHNGKRLNANGQVASASATPESGATADFAEFQSFRQHQRQQQNQQQRHQQQQQQQTVLANPRRLREVATFRKLQRDYAGRQQRQ